MSRRTPHGWAALRVRGARLTVIVVAALTGVVGLLVVTRALGPERVDAPPPEAEADSEVMEYELPVSSLAFPVRIQLQALLDEVERHVPVEWGTVEEPISLPDRGRTTASVALQRSPFRASVRGDTARLSATVYYGLQARYDLPLLPDIGMSCGTDAEEPRPRLSVTLEASLTLTSAWTLATRTRVTDVRPASTEDRDRCEVTLVGIDVTGSVVEAARGYLEDRRSSIDSVVARADVRSSFERWWNVLRTPISLGEGVWLELRPSGIRRGPVEGAGAVVEVQAKVDARPRVTFGVRPSGWTAPLPELGEGVSEGGLQILVEAAAEYGEASRRLTDLLGGTTLEAARRRFRIESLEVTGIGRGRVAVEVGIGGDARGSLFLVGTPRYEPRGGFITVPDLTLTVSTSNVLVTGASWILDSGLEAMLRDRARWPVAFAVERAEDALRSGLNASLAEGVRLAGTVREVDVLGVWATTRELIVRAWATGTAALLIEEGA